MKIQAERHVLYTKIHCAHCEVWVVYIYIRMVRVFTLPVGKTVKVGFEAQAPAGVGGERYYKEIALENKRVNNIRAGY